MLIGPPPTLADELVPLMSPVADIAEFNPVDIVPETSPRDEPVGEPSVVRLMAHVSVVWSERTAHVAPDRATETGAEPSRDTPAKAPHVPLPLSSNV